MFCASILVLSFFKRVVLIRWLQCVPNQPTQSARWNRVFPCDSNVTTSDKLVILKLRHTRLDSKGFRTVNGKPMLANQVSHRFRYCRYRLWTKREDGNRCTSRSMKTPDRPQISGMWCSWGVSPEGRLSRQSLTIDWKSGSLWKIAYVFLFIRSWNSWIPFAGALPGCGMRSDIHDSGMYLL